MKPGAPAGVQGFRVNVTSLPSTCRSHCPERVAAPGGVKGSLSQSQNTALTLVTAEGDTVTLSSSFEREVKFETYNSEGESSRMRSREWSKSVSLSIEGDLNREELRDIRKALRTIEKVNRTLMRGDVEKAAEQAEKLQRLDSIVSLDAELSITRQVTLETWSGEVPTQPVEPPPAPGVLPETVVNPEPEPALILNLIESTSTEPAR